MIGWIKDRLTKEMREELESHREAMKLSVAEVAAMRAEAANMRRLITALRDVNADLDRRLTSGEN